MFHWKVLGGYLFAVVDLTLSGAEPFGLREAHTSR